MNARSSQSGQIGIVTARSWLFVPATRPERFDKAVASGADLVILDLEDAVPAHLKAAARSAAVDWLSTGGSAAVRVNSVISDDHTEDLRALSGLPGLAAVMLPMASAPDQLVRVRRHLGESVALIPLIETAEGLLRAVELAAAAGVVRLAFGHLDFAFDIDSAPTLEVLEHARSSLVIASRAGGAAGPIDSVTTILDDPEATRRDAARARELGFTGKLCIHPSQVRVVNEAMSPTTEEIKWARRVLAASRAGAARVDGQMVDAPVFARAKRILGRGAATGC